MTIHAIADLHLDSGGKPMDVFGERWEHHAERIFSHWHERVADDDLVLLPGDISWAMQLSEAREHLAWIGALPGQKLLLRGNHDYWWSSIARVRDALAPGCHALQNDSFAFGGYLIAGARGWLLPGDETGKDDLKIYNRELIRLEMSLKHARGRCATAPLIAMMHYPPLTEEQPRTGFTELFAAYGVERAVYGHLHGGALRTAVRGEVDGIFYHQVSSDGLGFRPERIAYTL